MKHKVTDFFVNLFTEGTKENKFHNAIFFYTFAIGIVLLIAAQSIHFIIQSKL